MDELRGTAEGKRAREKPGRGYLVEEVTRNRAGHKSSGFRRRSRLRITHCEKPSSLPEIVIRYSSPLGRLPSSPTDPLTESEEHRTIFALLFPISRESREDPVENFKGASSSIQEAFSFKTSRHFRKI